MTSQVLTNFTPNQPATFMALPMLVIYSRPGPGIVWWRGGDAGVGAVCLNISVLPSPAERNCVIMPDSFYDSNQGFCLCKRPAPLCAAEQPRHYTENESTAIGWGGAVWESRTAVHGLWGWQECLNSLLPCKHNSLSYLQFINCKHANKQVSLHRIGHLPVCYHNIEAL